MTLVMDRSITDKKKEEWGKWFSNAAHDAGYKSQQEFADASGFTRVQVQRWETGAVRPREENIAAIAAALKSVATEEEVFKAAGYTPNKTPNVTIREERLPYNERMTEEEQRRVISMFEGKPRKAREAAEKALNAILAAFPDVDEDHTTHGNKAE